MPAGLRLQVHSQVFFGSTYSSAVAEQRVRVLLIPISARPVAWQHIGQNTTDNLATI